MTENELQQLTVEILLELIPKDYSIGRTHFEETNKKYICAHYDQALFDYDGAANELGDFLKHNSPDGPYLVYYASSPKEAMINCITEQGGSL